MIRHAEKSETTSDLSPQGYQRAQAYVNYFKTSSAVTRYGTPVAIYAMTPKSDGSQIRPFETVTPLAQALGLTIDKQFNKDDISDLVNDILSNPRYEGKMVLICWEHQVMGQIAAQFGINPAPDYPGSAYNWVWEIDFKDGAISNFTEFRADILPSDGPNPSKVLF